MKHSLPLWTIEAPSKRPSSLRLPLLLGLDSQLGVERLLLSSLASGQVLHSDQWPTEELRLGKILFIQCESVIWVTRLANATYHVTFLNMSLFEFLSFKELSVQNRNTFQVTKIIIGKVRSVKGFLCCAPITLNPKATHSQRKDWQRRLLRYSVKL